MIVTIHGQEVGVSRLGDGAVRIASPAAVMTLHRLQAQQLAAAIAKAAEAEDAEA